MFVSVTLTPGGSVMVANPTYTTMHFDQPWTLDNYLKIFGLLPKQQEGLPVLRATPTGISAVIDSDGRLLHSLKLGTAGVIDARLPAPKAPTPFARLGNLLPLLFALLLAALAMVAQRIAGRRKDS